MPAGLMRASLAAVAGGMDGCTSKCGVVREPAEKPGVALLSFAQFALQGEPRAASRVSRPRPGVVSRRSFFAGSPGVANVVSQAGWPSRCAGLLFSSPCDGSPCVDVPAVLRDGGGEDVGCPAAASPGPSWQLGPFSGWAGRAE